MHFFVLVIKLFICAVFLGSVWLTKYDMFEVCNGSVLQFVHEKVYDEVVDRLTKAYAQISQKMGDPLESESSVTKCAAFSAHGRQYKY